MKEVKFAVFTDLHYEHSPDGNDRLEFFIDKVKSEDIDFIVQLGDFCYPIEENRSILSKFDSLKIPLYSVIGNHDSDVYSREMIKDFLYMNDYCYSFTSGHVKFIILDSCYIKTGDGCVPYSKKNYDKSCDI